MKILFDTIFIIFNNVGIQRTVINYFVKLFSICSVYNL